MNKEQLLTIFSNILSEKNILRSRGFDEQNYKPHQFVVGAKHTIAADKENNGILTEEILERIPCEHIGCNMKYEEHTSDKTLILQLTRDASSLEVNEELIKIKQSLVDYKIKSVAFADTEEGYKFI